jgi:hypothetical protein
MFVISKQKLGFRLKNREFFVIEPKQVKNIPEEVANDDYFKLAVSSGVVQILQKPEKVEEKIEEKPVRRKKKDKEV